MSKTASYRQHHEELRAIAARIDRVLDRDGLTATADEAAAVVRELFGKFSVHLAIEDKSLYPRAKAAGDARLHAVASRFESEMGDLGQRFDAYRQSWPGPLAIGRDPARFAQETRAVLTALRERVAREETELYDLIDAA